MISHENRLLADGSREISPYSFRKSGKMSQFLSPAVVVIGPLWVKKRGNLIADKWGLKSIITNLKF